MANKELHIESIIIRFLEGKSSKKETAELRYWIQLHPDNKSEFGRMQALWDSIEVNKTITEEKINSNWLALEKTILSNQNYEEIKSYKHKKIIPAWVFKAAALFLFGFFSALGILFLAMSDRQSRLVYTEIVTPMGSNSNIVLPDGSKVWLNAGSTLKYPARFTNKVREVFLEGEAYFDVSKDRRKQFRVQTSDLLIHVFGTEFNVKSYPDDNTVETTLVEGSISIFKTTDINKEKEIILEPNQRLVLYRHLSEFELEEDNTGNEAIDLSEVKPINRLVLSKGIDANEFVSWKDGRLSITSEKMSDLIRKLERRFDVTVKFEDEEIMDYTYTGTITNETLEQVLTAIKLSSPVDFRIEDRKVTVMKNPDFEKNNIE